MCITQACAAQTWEGMSCFTCAYGQDTWMGELTQEELKKNTSFKTLAKETYTSD